MSKILISLLLLSLPLTFAACASGSTPSAESGKDDVAAVVNGTKISVADIDRVIAQQLSGQENQLSQMEMASARLQGLDSLITQEVLFQRAQKDNLNVTDDEVNQAIQSRKQEFGLTEEAFQKQLKESNQTEAQFKADMKKQLAINKLQDKLSSQLKVQDREVEEFFKANQKQFVAKVGINISDIIADPANNNMKFDVTTDAAAEAKIKDIYSRLLKGSDFATIARGMSEHETAARGGDFGFIPQEQFSVFAQQGLPAKLGEELLKKNEGDITAPIKDQAGRWHIFKLTGKRTEAKELTLNDPEVKKQISDAILNQRKQLMNAALMTRAMNESKIENYLAQRLLENPNSLGVLRPITPASSSSPAASSTGAKASPSATASPAK